jgi:hypothetical protein
MARYRPYHYIAIDKDVPIPELNPNRGGDGKDRPVYNKYPFEEMEVGDSFFCNNRTQAQLITSARQWATRRTPHPQFVSRAENGGTRIWRTS